MGIYDSNCSGFQYPSLYGFNCYNFSHDNTFGGSVYVSGTTCDGVQEAYTLNFGQSVCMDLDFPIITCDNPIIINECVPSSPTPTPTITPTNTPTMTMTPTNTPTQEPICPEQLEITAFDFPELIGFSGTYDRVYSFTGGSFNAAYIYGSTSATTQFFTGGVPPIPTNYSVFSRTDGINYYTIIGVRINPLLTSSLTFRIVRTTGDYIYNQGGNLVGATSFAIGNGTENINNILFPLRGANLGNFYVSYPEVCPTPTPTNTSSVTPTETPTNTPSVTPTMTPTSNPICPEELILTQTSPTGLSGYTGTYNRLYSWSGGSFNYAYYTLANSTWTFDTADGFGDFGVVYGRFDGTNYYTIIPLNLGFPTPDIQQYGITSRTDNYAVGLPSPSVFQFDNTLTTISNVIYPIGVGQNNFYISYPEICPTSTPTPSVTQTSTPTNTPSETPTETPTNTPTNTSTQTPTSTIGSTPTQTPSNTPTETPSNTPTETPTSTPTETPTSTPTETINATLTPTATPTGTPPCTYTIFTHGAVLGICSDFCNNNYLIQTVDCTSEPYLNLTIGDFIYGYSGQSGFIAVSDVSTDTSTGPFKIMGIDGTGEIVSVFVCDGGSPSSCIPL